MYLGTEIARTIEIKCLPILITGGRAIDSRTQQQDQYKSTHANDTISDLMV